MGGVLFRKIMEREPTNPDIKKMIEYGKAKKVAIGTPEDPKVISSSGSDPNSSSNPVSVKSEDEEKKKEREQREEREEKKREEETKREDEKQQQRIDTEAKSLQEKLKKRGEKEEDIDEIVKVFRMKRRDDYIQHKIQRVMSEEREVIDLTTETPFSQKGIYSGAVQDVLGLGGWEISGEFLEQKFYRFDKKDFESHEH